MSWKQCFSKLKVEKDGEKSREMHSEFRELKGWTDINRQTTWVVKWGLMDSMKLKHKMKVWTNMKFSPNQNHEWWGVILWYMYWDQWFEPVARYLTYTKVVSRIRVTCFCEIHPTSALRPNECYSQWSMKLGNEVSCLIHTQLQQ
jgi:hypothetical protein